MVRSELHIDTWPADININFAAFRADGEYPRSEFVWKEQAAIGPDIPLDSKSLVASVASRRSELILVSYVSFIAHCLFDCTMLRHSALFLAYNRKAETGNDRLLGMGNCPCSTVWNNRILNFDGAPDFDLGLWKSGFEPCAAIVEHIFCCRGACCWWSLLVCGTKT